VKKKRKPLDPRVRLGIAIGAPLVLLVAGWLLLIGPQRSKASDLQRQVADAQTQYATRQAQLLHVPKPVPIQAADLFGLVRAMPDQTDMPGIILQLNQVAAEAGISFDSISPQGLPVAGTGYQLEKISIGFTGNYYGLSDFLYRLRNLVVVRGGKLDATGRLFSVEQLSFGEATSHFPNIDAQLVVDAYVYGSAPAPAAAPVPTGTATSATTTTGTDTSATTTAATTTDSSAAAAAPASTGVNG
jgi:hypothetical protein